MKPVIWSWYKLYCLVSEESVWNSSWAAPSWFLGLELDSSLLIFPHEFPTGFPESTRGLGLVGCSGLVGVPGLPSVSLPDFPGSPPDFFMKFLIFLLFLYLLSHGSFSWMSWFSSCFLPQVPDSPSVTLPDCPGSPPDFLLKFFILLLFLFLLSWFLSWISWFSSCFLPEVPDSSPVSLPDSLVVLLILLAPLLNFLVRLEEGMRGFT